MWVCRRWIGVDIHEEIFAAATFPVAGSDRHGLAVEKAAFPFIPCGNTSCGAAKTLDWRPLDTGSSTVMTGIDHPPSLFRHHHPPLLLTEAAHRSMPAASLAGVSTPL